MSAAAMLRPHDEPGVEAVAEDPALGGPGRLPDQRVVQPLDAGDRAEVGTASELEAVDRMDVRVEEPRSRRSHDLLEVHLRRLPPEPAGDPR